MCYHVHTTTSTKMDRRKRYKQIYTVLFCIHMDAYASLVLWAERSNGGKTKLNVVYVIDRRFSLMYGSINNHHGTTKKNHHGTNMENHSTLQHNLAYIKVEILYICDLKLLICLHLFQIVYVCLHDFEYLKRQRQLICGNDCHYKLVKSISIVKTYRYYTLQFIYIVWVTI